jgi:hypothetical protein
MWVPGTIPPGATEAAVRAAWPGSTVATTDAGPPIPVEATAAAGGALWPQQPDTIPLRAEHDTDPLRALLAAGAAVRHHEHACVQILARPAPAGQVRQARRAGTTPHTTGSDLVGRTAGGLAEAAAAPVLWLAEVFLPGPSRTSNTRTAARTQPVVRDPVADAGRRTIVDKAVRVPHYQVAIRYAAATQAQQPTGSIAGRYRPGWTGWRTASPPPPPSTPAPTGYA